MENKKTIVAGSLIASAIISLTSLNVHANSNIFKYNPLGNGAEMRSSLNHIELSCGEKKEKDAKCGEKKTKDSKCGEKKQKDAKCGEKKGKDAKCGEKKAKDGKCGEGKCGEKKSPK